VIVAVSGNLASSMAARSTTTEVSRTPRSERSATDAVLSEDGVGLLAHGVEAAGRKVGEGRLQLRAADEALPGDGAKLRHDGAVAEPAMSPCYRAAR
jgi:hypothetical protein